MNNIFILLLAILPMLTVPTAHSTGTFQQGYHDGAVAADHDDKLGNIDVSAHPCSHIDTPYCKGFTLGYQNEAGNLQ